MGDIKLFRIANGKASPLVGANETIEKSLQTLFEQNLEACLGVRFLASEFVTTHGGRIDTLGIDENGCPIIIEYKRSTNESVITQGLFYLDWVMDHRGDFELLVLKKLGRDSAKDIDWSAPRLICVAGDFNRYDDYAVKQIERNIELIRYRRFGADLLMLDLVSASASASAKPVSSAALGGTTTYKSVSEVMSALDADMIDRFEALRAYIKALGDDVQETVLKYVAFKRIKNFACVEFRPNDGRILMYVKVDPTKIALESGFTRDVSQLGHYGTGDLEITLSKPEDLEKAKALIQQSYEAS